MDSVIAMTREDYESARQEIVRNADMASAARMNAQAMVKARRRHPDLAKKLDASHARKITILSGRLAEAKARMDRAAEAKAVAFRQPSALGRQRALDVLAASVKEHDRLVLELETAKESAA